MNGETWGLEVGLRRGSTLDLRARAHLREQIRKRLKKKRAVRAELRSRQASLALEEIVEVNQEKEKEKEGEEKEGEEDVREASASDEEDEGGGETGKEPGDEAGEMDVLQEEEKEQEALSKARTSHLVSTSVIASAEELRDTAVADDVMEQWPIMGSKKGGGLGSGVDELGKKLRQQALQLRRSSKEMDGKRREDGVHLDSVAWWFGPIAGSLAGGVRVAIPALALVASGRRVPAEARFWHKEELLAPLSEGGLKGRALFPPLQESAEARYVDASTACCVLPWIS